MRTIAAILLLTGASLYGFQSSRMERFDTSGLPERASTFLEQQIFEMIGSHQPGDLTDAAAIQRKLSRYYSEKGDRIRAAAALRLAAEAENQSQQRTLSPDATAPPLRAPSRLSGNYYGSAGRTLHTWEFHADETFLHSWIVSGAGTNVRNSERGTFRLRGDTLEIILTSSATGFTTPGVGGQSTLAGGGSDGVAQTRHLSVQFDGAGNPTALDGIPIKPKSW